MKRITSILLGLILAAAFSLTGCRSAAEPETDKGDPVSSAVTASNAPQAGREAEANQPEQTAGGLKITAEGVPVEVCLASDGQYRCEYDEEAYAVTTVENGSTFEIEVTDLQPEVDSGNSVVIYIPNQSYTLLTVDSEGSSLILPAIYADITVTSDASSVVVNLPADYNKTLNYAGNASSCLLSMSGLKDFAVSAEISASAVSAPSGWPAYDVLSSEYRYTSGTGTAKINLDVTSGSFVFEYWMCYAN